jgi:DNA-binding HxlR family transcriptional regulator
MNAPWDEGLVKPVLELAARRWVRSVISHLWNGPLRRRQLFNEIGGVSEKSLTETLRVLEGVYLVQRRSFDVIPPHVEYSLTENGQTFGRLLIALGDLPSGLAAARPSRSAEGPIGPQ